MSNLTKTLAEVQAKRQELTEQVKGVLVSGIQEFMKEHPEIKCLSWTQYTPYFNDGDECVFGVGTFYISTTTTDAAEGRLWDDENFHEVYGKSIPEGVLPTTWDELKEFTKLLSGAEDDLRAAFGDHVQVIVTQDGVETEGYDHD